MIFKEGPNGEKLEPYEEAVIDVDEAFTGPVIEGLGRRGGRMQDMAPAGDGRMRLEYVCRRAASSATDRSSSPTPGAPGS